MAIVNRWYQILQLLVTNKELTISQMQKKLETSPQTVRKSVESLNEELIDIAQIVQEKNEFHLEIDNFEYFDEIMAGSLKHKSDFNSSSKRMAFIIKRLLEAENFVLIDDLSEELDVSRGTVAKDIREMKVLVQPFNVEVVGTPNRGIRMQGKEFDLRLLHVYYVQDYFEEEFLSEETRILISQLTGETDISKYQGILLRKVVSIVMQRMLTGHELTEIPEGYQNCVQNNHWIEQLLVHLELSYSITLNHFEKEFLSFPFNMSANQTREKELVDEAALKKYFKLMMQQIYAAVVLDINEKILFQEMKDHLMYMVNRLIFRMEFQDLFYGEIEKQYPFAYELAKIGLQELGGTLHRSVSSVEYSYLALYFELVLRNQTDEVAQKEIAIVCSTGRGTSLIIRRQLEKVLGSEVKITHFSEEKYEQQDLNQYFAIFTTIPLKNVEDHTPVIHLTNLFNDSWLHTEWEKAKQSRAAEMNEVSLHFHLLDNNQTYRANLLEMIHSLQEKALVDNQFQQRIFEREEKYTTIFEEGIAFPHTINSFSEKIILSVGIFPESFVTAEGIVEVVFLLAIPENLTLKVETELLHLYDNFFAVVGNQVLRTELCQQKDLASLQEWMKGKGIIS